MVRQIIRDQGYGDYFTHRTGHNINIDNHGPGANLDGLETQDDRLLIPRTFALGEVMTSLVFFTVSPILAIDGRDLPAD